MRNKLQLSEITETVNRGKNYFELFDEIYSLEELFQNTIDSKLFEYAPMKIVACFEQFFREEYKEILVTPKIKERLKEVDVFKNTKFEIEIADALQNNTITLGDYLSLLVPCSRLEDIDKTLSQLLDIKFLDEIKKKEGGERLIKTINEIFRLRHIYCHEVPYKNTLNKKLVTEYISGACQFLEYSDDTIRYALYSDHYNYSILEEMQHAKEGFENADKQLEELIKLIKTKQKNDAIFYNDFRYIDAWREYRELRAKADSAVGHDGGYSPLHYYRNLERTTKNLIKELSDDFKYELRK